MTKSRNIRHQSENRANPRAIGDEDRALIKHLREMGLSLGQIARRIGRYESSVRRYCKTHNIKAPAGPAPEEYGPPAPVIRHKRVPCPAYVGPIARPTEWADVSLSTVEQWAAMERIRRAQHEADADFVTRVNRRRLEYGVPPYRVRRHIRPETLTLRHIGATDCDSYGRPRAR